MSPWKQTGDYNVKTYRRKALWERIKSVLDGLAGGMVVLVIVIAIFG